MTAQQALAPRSRRVLEAIAFLLEARGESPSLGEIGTRLGRSPAAAKCWVDRLAEQGWITRHPRLHRTIELTEAGKKLVKQLRKKAA